MRFADRREAGRRLAQELTGLELIDPVVLALPRGGVPVAFEVAGALGAPLDVLVARKIGAPFQPELGVGAIAEGDVTVLEPSTLHALGLTPEDVRDTVAQERHELRRRVGRYRGGRQPVDVSGRSAVVVDDGLATGVTARAALQAVRQRAPREVILAVPVGPTDAEQIMGDAADRVVVAEQPAHLSAVGQWYVDFTQTSDEIVIELLQRAADRETG